MQNGSLTIVDRKKHIFKLQQGEYVAPEKIENIYLRSPYVSQIFVHGDSLKVIIIVSSFFSFVGGGGHYSAVSNVWQSSESSGLS